MLIVQINSVSISLRSMLSLSCTHTHTHTHTHTVPYGLENGQKHSEKQLKSEGVCASSVTFSPSKMDPVWCVACSHCAVPTQTDYKDRLRLQSLHKFGTVTYILFIVLYVMKSCDSCIVPGNTKCKNSLQGTDDSTIMYFIMIKIRE